jgi:uncharacterized protein YcfJ
MKLQKSIALGALFLCNLSYSGVILQNNQNANDRVTITQSVPVYRSFNLPETKCYPTERLRDNSREIGIGSLIGAAVGAKYDAATAVAGLLLGGLAADALTQNTKDYRNCHSVDKIHRELIGYDVRYVYRGREYIQRLDYDPGVGTRMEVQTSIGR